MNDIDCNDFSYSSVGVGFDGAPFTGVLDGQSYKVENLEIHAGSSGYVGLIGALGSSGEVRDIGVVNANISGNYTVGGLFVFNNKDGDFYSSY